MPQPSIALLMHFMWSIIMISFVFLLSTRHHSPLFVAILRNFEPANWIVSNEMKTIGKSNARTTIEYAHNNNHKTYCTFPIHNVLVFFFSIFIVSVATFFTKLSFQRIFLFSRETFVRCFDSFYLLYIGVFVPPFSGTFLA